jgi:hypothetical protein
MSGDLPLYAKLELRAITNSNLKRDRPVMMSSTRPSTKYSCSGSPLIFWKGKTAMEGLSGKGSSVDEDCDFTTGATVTSGAACECQADAPQCTLKPGLGVRYSSAKGRPSPRMSLSLVQQRHRGRYANLGSRLPAVLAQKSKEAMGSVCRRSVWQTLLDHSTKALTAAAT